MDQINPCPCCGNISPEGKNVSPHQSIEMIAIWCPDCHMQGPRCSTLQEAIEKWNELPRKSFIDQLEKEADWLACELEKKEHGCKWCDGHDTCQIRLPFGSGCGYQGPDNYRDAAREATKIKTMKKDHISQERLDGIRNYVQRSTPGYGHTCHDDMADLLDEIELLQKEKKKLEKEVTWLCGRLSSVCRSFPSCIECPFNCKTAYPDWKKLARESVEGAEGER